MAKKKKTRQDKIKADLRHELPQSPLYVVSQPTEKIANIPAQVVPQSNSVNIYFLNDLKRTVLLILGILAAQFMLFYILQNHLIKLHFISY